MLSSIYMCICACMRACVGISCMSGVQKHPLDVNLHLPHLQFVDSGCVDCGACHVGKETVRLAHLTNKSMTTAFWKIAGKMFCMCCEMHFSRNPSGHMLLLYWVVQTLYTPNTRVFPCDHLHRYWCVSTG